MLLLNALASTYPITPLTTSTTTTLSVMGLEQMNGYNGVNGSDSTYATPLTEQWPSEEPRKSVEQPKVPREIRAVQDAKGYKSPGKNIVVCLDGTGDQVRDINMVVFYMLMDLLVRQRQQQHCTFC